MIDRAESFESLLAVGEGETWDAMCLRVGRVLGMSEPVPSHAMQRMIADGTFAHDVLSSRNVPAFLEALFDDPASRAYGGSAQTVHRSNAELLAKAAGALLTWGKTGFSQVNAATYERRFGACRACPHLVDPPADRLLYKLSTGSPVERKICDACGCVASRKARLPSEGCPQADPSDPSRTRWGEPLR
jgi:hypothetical protein